MVLSIFFSLNCSGFFRILFYNDIGTIRNKIVVFFFFFKDYYPRKQVNVFISSKIKLTKNLKYFVIKDPLIIIRM